MTKDEALKLALEALEAERDIYRENDEDGAPEYILEAITAIEEALAQFEAQEPVAWMNDMGTHIDLNVSGRGMPLYTTPQQRTWVGLTDEDIAEVAERMEATDAASSFWREFARAIEAAHNIKE